VLPRKSKPTNRTTAPPNPHNQDYPNQTHLSPTNKRSSLTPSRQAAKQTLTHHASRITFHASRFTPHASRLTHKKA
jgi:hypothetical protein